MEDIEDLLVGSGGAPPGFRLPLAAAVGVNPNKKKIQPNLRKASLVEDSLTTPRSLKILGTQTIYMKTFGCSHNQVGHTKGYVQVLVVGPESMLGTSAIVRINSVGRWSVFGEVIENLNKVNINDMDAASGERGQ